MKKLNSVIDGDFEGKDILSGFGNLVCISTSTFGRENIDRKNVEHITLLSEKLTEKQDISYELKIKFNSGKESILYIDNEIYKKLIDIWPELKINKLT